MKLSTMAAKAFTRTHIALYRKTGGRIGGRFRGSPVLLLTTTGRRTGAPRTAPLFYVKDGDRLAVAASGFGLPANPPFYLNVQVDPEVSVQIGRRVQDMVARTATPEERERLWPRFVAMYPAYAMFQQRTSREIPIVVLEPL